MKRKACIIHVEIHFRDFGKEQTPRYCVEASCKTHHTKWMGLTDDFKIAGDMGHAFPLVSGGMSSGKDAYPVPDDCLISKIPQKKQEE